jgi:hypothetical protein
LKFILGAGRGGRTPTGRSPADFESIFPRFAQRCKSSLSTAQIIYLVIVGAIDGSQGIAINRTKFRYKPAPKPAPSIPHSGATEFGTLYTPSNEIQGTIHPRSAQRNLFSFRQLQPNSSAGFGADSDFTLPNNGGVPLLIRWAFCHVSELVNRSRLPVTDPSGQIKTEDSR